MSTDQSTEDLHKLTKICIAMAILSFIFIGAGHYVNHKELAGHLLTEIGIAWAVAVILAATIEYQFRKMEEKRQREARSREEGERKQQRKILMDDVFAGVLGYRLPPDTVPELGFQILDIGLYRKDFKVTYKLSVLPDNPNYVLVDSTLSYKIINMTPAQKSYNFTTTIEYAPTHDLNELVKFKTVSVEGCVKPINIDPNEVDHKIRPNHKCISKKIDIKGKSEVSAMVNSDLVRILEGGVSFILTPILTVGFDLTVEAPEVLEVSATPYLPQDLEDSGSSPKDGKFKWQLKRPLLPYQGVYVTWKRKAAHVEIPTEIVKPITETSE